MAAVSDAGCPGSVQGRRCVSAAWNHRTSGTRAYQPCV